MPRLKTSRHFIWGLTMRLKKHDLPEMTGVYTTCKICKETKDDALFKWSNGVRLGLVCRECDRQKKRKLYEEDPELRAHVKSKTAKWLVENAEQAKETRKKYREGNEELKAKKRAYQQANKETENARCREWYQNNKDTELFKQKGREYRELNKEQIAEACRLRYEKIPPEVRREKAQVWRDKNPGLTSFYSRKYMLDKDKRTPGWANLEAIRQIYINTPKGFAVDHIIPLRGKLVSGLHVESNLQYLPKSENCQKLNRFYPDEFDESYTPGARLIGYFDGRNCCIPVGFEDEYFEEHSKLYYLLDEEYQELHQWDLPPYSPIGDND